MIYKNMPYKKYAETNGFRSHYYKSLAISPATLKYDIEHPMTTTDSMKIGLGLDDLVTDQSTWFDKYAVIPKCDRRTKEGKAQYQAFEESNSGKVVLTEEQHQTIINMMESLERSTIATAFISSALKQSVLHWEDPVTKVMCKARPDGLIDQANIIYDLKTTGTYAKDFRYQLKKLGYGFQAAHYMMGAAACGITVKDFVFIVVESFPPYGVQCFRLMDDIVRAATLKARELLALYAECAKANQWPGYADQMLDLTLSDTEVAQINL